MSGCAATSAVDGQTSRSNTKCAHKIGDKPRLSTNFAESSTNGLAQSTKTVSSNGLPDLLPVTLRPSRAVVQEPTSYILLPATAVDIRPVVTANMCLIPTINSPSTSTILVVGSAATNLPQICTSSFSSPRFSTFKDRQAITASHFADGGCFVDNASLRQSMGRNRESLKRKLLQRRSVRELVEQGILPPPKTPPSFYEQRLKLERAKMSDILKHKIEHRPDKQQLVSQHILLDSCADPGILEKQQQLKKCKLADSLNEKLANRPGPLELVQDNILHVDAALEQAIKDGRLQFKPTSAGLVQKHPQPVFVMTQDAQTPNSEYGRVGCLNSVLVHSSFGQTPSMEVVTTVNATSETRYSTGASPATMATKPKPKKTKSKGRAIGCIKNGVNVKPSANTVSSKLIRFEDSHEGVPLDSRTNGLCFLTPTSADCTGRGVGTDNQAISAHNLTPPLDESGRKKAQETSYDLLLQQQQLLLQWQYELQQKYPNSTVQLVSLSSKAADHQQQQFLTNYSRQGDASSVVSSVQSSPGAFVNGFLGGAERASPDTPTSLTRSDSDGCSSAAGQNSNKAPRRLEDMKVNDLKMECKKRNLPVSGSKSNIVERLKPYEDGILASCRQCLGGSQQQPDCAAIGSNPNSPAGNAQRGALPPIAFLCASSGQNAAVSSAACINPGYHQGAQCLLARSSSRQEAAGCYANRSSSSSDFASNYSSPGIDLSGLNFGSGAPCAGPEEVTTDVTPATRAMEQYTFSAPNFGAQFLVTPCGNDANGRETGQQRGYDGAMGTDSGGQNGTNMSVFQMASVPNDFQSSNIVPTSSPLSLNAQHHHQRLPFLQAANTLAVHEEALRQQQKKIEEVQKQIQKSQELLRQQQQMILAAKQMQSEASEGGASDTECILSQLDTKQIQKAHIQLFLQQKIQQQQLQQQINVQQELMEIQQKLQEEMTVHQALNEVVRLLREEPRVSILLLYLLRRYQIQQQQQQSDLSHSSATVNQPQHQSSCAMECDGADLNTASRDQQQHDNSSSPASNPPKSVPRCEGQDCGQTAFCSGHALTKNRQGSGQHPKKSSQASIMKASSVPTSPAKSKSSSSMGDMEEIFRTVLDHASKATGKQGDCAVLNEGQPAPGALPSFDQLLQPSRPDSEIETVISATNGSGVLMTSSHKQQLSILDQLPRSARVTSAAADSNAVNGMAPTASAYTYTRNEAFDDLMEVLRNNDGPFVGSDPSSGATGNESMTPGHNALQNDQLDGVASQVHQQLHLSAFGAQEVADLLGTEWFNVESLLPQSACPGIAIAREGLHSTQIPEMNVFGMNAMCASGRPEHKSGDRHGDHPANAMKSVVSSDMNEQMDWLDLILPSPSSGGGSVLHELPMMNCLPMDTDCIAAVAGESRKKDSDSSCSDFGDRLNSLLATSTHNPVLSMSACASSEAI